MKIGDIVLKPGDTLLLEAHPNSSISIAILATSISSAASKDFAPPRHERAWVAGAVFLGMIIAAGTGAMEMIHAAMLAAGLMIITRCCTSTAARQNVDWQVLVAIAASFGLGRAMETTGAAQYIAESMLGVAGNSRWAALAVIYLLTIICTELMSNNAAAVLMFPIALATARRP